MGDESTPDHLAPFDRGAVFFQSRGSAMTMKSDEPWCMYCGKDVDPDHSHGEDPSTGRYFHIQCFMEHEPRGREVAMRAQEVAEQELERMKRGAH